jgi:retinol-binding protein 3
MKKSFLHIAYFIVLLSYQSIAAELSIKEKDKTFNELQNKIIHQYVLTNNIDKITAALSTLKVSNEYKQVTTHKKLASVLAKTIREFDGHFSVLWSDPLAETKQSKDYEGWFPMLSRKNSGFNKVEILKGNIGYIDFWGFDHLNESSKAKAKAVMTFVEDTDAVIFDLRKNGGGSAVMIQFISSHFFIDKTHLNSFYNRKTEEFSEFWTFDDIEGKIRPNVPIYILTSDFTFSAAEEFAYNFQNLKRATVIGESTGGGANPIYLFDLGHGFRASIPISKAVNPISKTNWEGIGVQPDIVIDAEDAFDHAYEMALKTIKAKIKNQYQLKELNQKIKALEKRGFNG